MKYKINISATADGTAEYLQIISEDFEVNIVLIAEKFTIEDKRPTKDDG